MFMSLSRRGNGLAESVGFGNAQGSVPALGIPVLTALSELELLVWFWCGHSCGSVSLLSFFIFPVPSEFSLVQDDFDFDGLRAQTAFPSPILA